MGKKTLKLSNFSSAGTYPYNLPGLSGSPRFQSKLVLIFGV
jgi:hypothetical protein